MQSNSPLCGEGGGGDEATSCKLLTTKQGEGVGTGKVIAE